MDDVADIATATEHGLFTSSSFAVIPDGASPVPVDYTLSSITFDTILMGEEVAGGGFGGANAYATAVVGQAIKDQTNSPDCSRRRRDDYTVGTGVY